MRRRKRCLALLAGLSLTGMAAAQQESATETETRTDSKGYLSVLPFYLSADEERGTTEDGRGLAIAYGRNVRGGWFWEAQAFGSLIETGDSPLSDHYQYGAGFDMGYRFLHGDRTTPYVLLGLGAVRNDVQPQADDDTDFFSNVAVGFLTRELGNAGVRIRGEARYVRDDLETSAGFSGMNDWRIGLGVTVPLGRRVIEREVVRERVVTERVEVPAPAEITDSDNDGVPDQTDRCPGTLEGLATDNRGCAAQSGSQTLRLEGVTFEFNSARLTPEATATLRAVAEALRGEPDLRAEIAGHTDSSGADEYNLRLSQQRADAVLTFLANEGIDRTRLVARGYGETQPVADNSTEAGRARNRRVEFRVLN
ncbi:MAG TPA: OmpA family protein [Gammaproteobacteria bacterium]